MKVRSSSLTCFDPKEMDSALDGMEINNRQLGRGRFSGELFRAVFGSVVLDTGDYNDIPISVEGSIGNRILIILEPTNTRSIRLNGEQLKESSVGVYRENRELFARIGEYHHSWLTFQIEHKDLERAGCVSLPENFALIDIGSPTKSYLVTELLQLTSTLRNKKQPVIDCLDPKMTKDHLASLFAVALSSGNKNEKLNNEDCLRTTHLLEEYMETHLDERITMMDLCILSGKSERTLRRFFQKIYGISPRTMLTVHRLNAVYRILSSSSAQQTSVTEIALQYGFLNLGRFSGEYNKHFGEYPSETLAKN